MIFILVICVLLTTCYIALFIAYIVGWYRQKTFVPKQNTALATFITVVIPARNEAANIGPCLASVLVQQYPNELFEVIVVDDHSTDDTAAIAAACKDSRVRCIKLAEYLPEGKPVNAYKKAALAAGISAARGSLIVTTDADCLVPPLWLHHIACLFEQEHPAMIVAPVIYDTPPGLLPLFQLIDFMGMQGITAATNILKLGNMSNGANLAFRRDVFNDIGGYSGIDHLASGDDYLLMTKISKTPGAKIAYLKSPEAIVTTQPQPTWGSFLNQRIRWASKSGKYDDKRLTTVLMLVYVFNLTLVILALLGFADVHYWYLLCGMLGIKIIIEYIYMMPVAAFFSRQWTQKYFPFLQLMHIIYIIVAGFLGLAGDYQWKGRKVK